MSQGLVIAGLAAAALYLLSPDLRRSVNGFLEQLSTEERRKSQLLEAERRAAIISELSRVSHLVGGPSLLFPHHGGRANTGANRSVSQ